MKFFGFEFGKRSARSPSRKRIMPIVSSRTFAAANQDRLTASFTGSHLSINEELRRSLPMLQRRSRDLCENNDYARRFIKMVEKNVVGQNGITLQCQYQKPDGSPDLADQQFVEGHWKQWGKRRNCSADGRLSWIGIQSLVIKTVARDGEVLIEKIRSKRGKYILKLRVMECDHLDVNHNEQLSSGRRIVMGIELDRHDAPIAYWLSDKHPGDIGSQTYHRPRRVPAENIIHLFVSDRPGQLRGIPWMHSAIRRLNMLGGYEEAELVAARIGASKMGFFTSETGADYTADDADPAGQDYDDAELIDEASPGEFHQLPHGTGFTPFDPQHPTSAFPDFCKAMLRGFASGVDVAYENLSNNREDVNFSSIRAGTLDERDSYRVIQTFLTEGLHDEIHDDWLVQEIELGLLSAFPNDKIETKFSQYTWQPRGWDWVAPHQDVKAKIDEYYLGATSLSEIVATKGKSLDDVFRQRQADDQLAEKYGQTVGQVIQQISQTQPKEVGENAEA